MKISLNLVKLHIKYCRLFFSGHGVYSNTMDIRNVYWMSALALAGPVSGHFWQIRKKYGSFGKIFGQTSARPQRMQTGYS